MFYVRTGNQQRGPYSGPQLHQLAAAGELKPADYIRQHNSDQWTLAAQIPGLFPAEISSPAGSLYPPAPGAAFDPYQSPAGMGGRALELQRQLKHSGVGIASFVLSVVMGILIVSMCGIAGYMQGSRPGGINQKSTEVLILGLCLLGSLFLDLVALGLGIAGLVQRDRKKIFAILGTIFSLVTLLVFGGLMVVGMMAA